jgi:hypothetical protein
MVGADCFALSFQFHLYEPVDDTLQAFDLQREVGDVLA